MKVSCSSAALVLASAMGSSSAATVDKISFGVPIGFTQYDGGCPERDDPAIQDSILYQGSINSIQMLGEGEFCVVDNVPSQTNPGETELAFSKLMVVGCESDEVIDHWYKCTDDTCGDCEIEYRSTTSWDSFEPVDMMEQCYVYHFSMDSHDTVKASRNAPLGVTPGDFKNLVTVSYNFDTDANPDDVDAYMSLVHDNSCIKDGAPAEVSSITKNDAGDEIEEPTVSVTDTESSSNIVALSTVAVVAALATSMMAFV